MYTTFDIDKDGLNYKIDFNLEETKALRSELSGKVFTIDDIRRVALWKLDRVIEIPENVLCKLTDLVSRKDLEIDDPICKEVFELLIGAQCRGMRAPMASTILKFLRPDVFPIIDVRAYRVLYGVKPPNKLMFDTYLVYGIMKVHNPAVQKYRV